MALYLIQNEAVATEDAGPPAGVTTSATLFTMLQVQLPTNLGLDVVEWGVSFNGGALAVPFACDLMDSGLIAATVTALAAADFTGVDAEGYANVEASNFPFVVGTTASGYTSSAEGTITAPRTFDPQQVEPIAGYWKQFPEGVRPYVPPSHNLRIRVKGDGVVKCTCYVVVSV